MKRNMKIMISALSVMLIMALAVTVLSFSYADNQKPDAEFEDTNIVLAAENMDNNTIIDNIIINSNSTLEDVDTQYHIVEIGSSTTASTLSDFVTSKGFETYVIEGHKTIADFIKEGSVTYKYYSAAEVTNENTTALADISNADFIYVSNDAANEFTKTNDLSEELTNLLRTYAVGSYKPLVIDKPKATTVTEGTATKTTNDLANAVFGPNEMYYYTFKWDRTLSANTFLTHKNGSLYLGINGDRAKSAGKWSELIIDGATDGSTDDTTEIKKYNMSNILVVSADGTAGDMTTELLAGATLVDLTTTKLMYNTATPTAVDGTVYDITGSDFQKYAYNGRYSTPDYVKVTTITVADSADSAIVFENYDMVIMETSCGGSQISMELYKKYAAAMYGGINIVYDAAMANAVVDESGDVPTDYKDTNYTELFYSVATTEYEARFQNIMVTTRSDFDMITSSSSTQSAKVIADLINASSYRGIGGQGSGSSSNMFTVLEIQPCYPIDEERALEVGTKVARANNYVSIYGSGNYYTIPADVINGKSKEQVKEGSEYYAWELSKAKIAEALGLNVNQINLVQMSSEELAGSKTEIVGTYDLIYVGGNISALKDAGQYRSLTGLVNWGGVIGNHIDTSKLTSLPIYTMYAHSGDIVNLALGHMAQSPGPANGGHGGKPFAQVYLNGSYQETFNVLNGNDITYNKYLELSEYVSAGMPVVISKELSAAYTAVKTDGYLQNSLDPDSNMFKFLEVCKTTSDANVLWDFDHEAVVDTDNNGGVLGDTLTGYVSVFASENGSISLSDPNYGTGNETTVVGMREKLASLYSTANHRPKLTVSSMPPTYNQYDSTSKLESGELKFNYSIVGGGKYEVNLYIDDNGDSVFDRSTELMASGSATELTCTLSEKYFGPVYWMLEATDTVNGMSTSTTGLAYVKNKTNETQTVRVLQLMPGEVTQWGNTTVIGEGAEGYNSLYFCTVCQQTYERLEYNPWANTNERFSYGALYGGNYDDSGANGVNGHYLGKHEHTFGIVKYDSNLAVPDKTDSSGNTVYGRDDWDVNLADEVSDLYDFDLDIMLRNEYEAIAKEIHEAYDFSGWTDAQKQAKIAAFKIDESDADYAYYTALTDDDEKLAFIMQRRYAQVADIYLDLYEYMTECTAIEANETTDIEYNLMFHVTYDEATDTLDTPYLIQYTTVDGKKEIDAVLDEILSNLDSPLGNQTFQQSTSFIRSEIERMKELGTYYDFYSMSNGQQRYNDISASYLSDGKSFNTTFDKYTEAKDLELTYLELYKRYSRLAAGSEWLLECYDTVIIGPSEDFGGDDFGADANLGTYGLADLEYYVANDGNVLLFHDTLTKFVGEGTTNLTTNLRGYFGMDRYHMELPEGYSKTDEYYLPYATTKNEDQYFMSELNPLDTTDTKYSTWLNNMKTVFGSTPAKYLSSVAYTDSILITADNNPYSMPYKYAEMSWAIAGYWYNAASFSAKENTKYGTDKASQNNVGIVTMFPFTLSSELNISGTHSQAYAVDLENTDMTVWYSLAGGTNTKEGSSMYAASPRDAMDNYFIYTYNNVNYCGAGHSKVTGVGKDNNDERRLYINIICNSVKKSVKQPDIYVYDYGTNENEIIKKDGEGYKMKVDSIDEYPEFSFKVEVDDETKLTQVRIYYDLDYLDNKTDAYSADEFHKLIVDWSSANVTAGKIKDVFRYDASLLLLLDENGKQIPETYIAEDGTEYTMAATMLKLQEEYFEPYNGEYTYIVIEATDANGNKTYKRIKIQLKAKLFNLT